MNLATDCRLIDLAVQGDREAFAELVRRHQAPVFNTAYRMLANHRDAEDAAQEAFIRAYRAFDRFDPTRPFLPWVKRITVNICLNRIKADHPAAPFDDQMPPPEPGPGPEAQAASRERGAQVRAAIASLPPNYRAVIELRHFQSLSYAEMAESLQRPLSTIKSDLFRARRILAERLKDLGPQWNT